MKVLQNLRKSLKCLKWASSILMVLWTLVIWEFQERFSSTTKLDSFSCFTFFKTFPLTIILRSFTGSVCNLWHVVIKMAFVLSLLMAILLSSHQFTPLQISGFSFCSITSSVPPAAPSVLSSTYISNFDCTISRAKSFMYMINSKGPRMEPCGTPDVIVSDSDLFWLIWTYCFLSVKYDVNQHKALTLNLYCLSFLNNKSWFTMSNALPRSRKISPVKSPLFILLDHYEDCSIQFLHHVSSLTCMLWDHKLYTFMKKKKRKKKY